MEEEGQGKVVSAFASLVERIVLNQTNPDPELGDDRSEYLGGQNHHPFLSFSPYRQAMSMAIDRGRISEELYGLCRGADLQPGHGSSELCLDRERRVPVPGYRRGEEAAG